MKNFNSKLKIFSALFCTTAIACSGFALAGCGEDDQTIKISSVAELEQALGDEDIDGKTLTLTADLTLDDTLLVENTITIDGQGKYTIKANKTWAGTYKNLVSVEAKEAKTLTLKNITIDGNNTVRCVYADGENTLKVEGATITNGSRGDTNAPGVYVTQKAHFEMKSGKIVGNAYPESNANKDSHDYIYSQDLWIGANATGNILGGEIGYMFVNANDYSAINPANFLQVTVNGGKIENAYVEYFKAENASESDAGATLLYKNGVISNLFVAQNVNGVNQKVEALAKGTTYTGGKDYNA